jgi:hypothetical protein
MVSLVEQYAYHMSGHIRSPPPYAVSQLRNLSPRLEVDLTASGNWLSKKDLWAILGMWRGIEELEVEPHEGNPKPTVTHSWGPAQHFQGLTYKVKHHMAPGHKVSMSIASCIHSCSTHFLFQESNLSAIPYPSQIYLVHKIV